MADVFAQALAEMPMPEYGVGTAWSTEECPFCAWRGEADLHVPPEEQAHDENCPWRLARLVAELPVAPVTPFIVEHKVGIDQGQRHEFPKPHYTHYQGVCETCGWHGRVFAKDGTDQPWEAARDEVFAHREETREEADGMDPPPNTQYVYES